MKSCEICSLRYYLTIFFLSYLQKTVRFWPDNRRNLIIFLTSFRFIINHIHPNKCTLNYFIMACLSEKYLHDKSSRLLCFYLNKVPFCSMFVSLITCIYFWCVARAFVYVHACSSSGFKDAREKKKKKKW